MTTFKSIQIEFGVNNQDWPELKANIPNELSLTNANFNLEPNRNIIFGGNGQISAVGDLSFLTAGNPTVPALKIFANGNVGIGTGTRQPTDKLEIAGSLKLETGLSVNQFSGDITNSDQVVPTAKAVKTYVDSKASPELPDGSVTDRKIANNAVTTDKIANNSIAASKIQNGAIAREKLDPSISFDPADGAVTTSKIADNSITTAKIQNGAITQEKLAASISLPITDGSVGTAKLANSAITTDKIADKSITAAKLNFSISPGSSQWKGKDGEPIFYSGNVGIGTTSTPQAKLQVANGAIMPSAGNSETAGIIFPKDAFGGSGDAAWIRYYARSGEATTLEIGTSNDADDHIALMPSGNVGIGTTNPSTTLHVKDTNTVVGENAPEVETHVALIENTSGRGADVLALKVGYDNPDLYNNFITFYANDKAIGSIEGNPRVRVDKNDGSHYHTQGISFQSVFADYAECLPRLKENEAIGAGDIVGVLDGRVTKVTENAHHVMVITDRPIVLGNAPEKSEKHLYEKVSFLGQVPIKVRGKVSAGDCIIPSGLNDGTGVALSRHEMSLATYAQIVGTAWESSEEEGVKRVNAVIGLNSSYSPVEALMRAMQTQQAEIDFLKTELKQLREQQKEQQFLKA
ncbi:hypothetical protein [Tolypothrix sp. FACHB-123]|uniref:hypothetical protein n=1 Tax=Tolypothrix sp. FACHB-123 TaxID=2692868 RepID=UPI0018EFBB68|nr:hypothetical protein [Tolypothrix sp. FACHB-123]